MILPFFYCVKFSITFGDVVFDISTKIGRGVHCTSANHIEFPITFGVVHLENRFKVFEVWVGFKGRERNFFQKVPLPPLDFPKQYDIIK